MKKIYMLALTMVFAVFNAPAQMRYLNEVFSSWQYAKDSVYGSNIEVLTGSPVLKALKCDIYQPPTTDTASSRPLIVLLHTGSFLPKYINQNPTGFKDDSATMEIARGFAKRGYVVCVPTYRQGWNPAASTQEARAKSIMEAVYRAEQDAKAAVRYMRKNASVYKVDTNKVILGGQGTGGYIAFTYAYVHTNAEMRVAKFISTGGQPYIDTALLGDIDNVLPGTISVPNNVGYSSKVNMIFNLGGAIGDINWMNTGEPPVVGFHSYTDPFAPDTSGIVYVPGTVPQAVIPVDGSRNICRLADQLNIEPWKQCVFTDPYTTEAKKNNEGLSGYYRLKIAYPAPYAAQSAPWEWWDSATSVGVAYLTFKAIGRADTTALKDAKQCHLNGMATNQYMSKAKALAYIDTNHGYLAPRNMVALKLPGYLTVCPQGGVGMPKALQATEVKVYPNPAHGEFTVQAGSEIRSITLMDVSGREVLNTSGNGYKEVTLSRAGISNGVYLVKITTAEGSLVQRVVLN